MPRSSPQAIGLAATWDPPLEQVAGVIREQMLAVGARLALAPVLDVARDPRWGRVEETYGEDPVLTGTLGAAVRGLQTGQTGDLRNGVIATGKHFLAYAMSEGGRNWNPVQMGPRKLQEVYAEPFAAAIRDAGILAIMNSYASVDGVRLRGQPCYPHRSATRRAGLRGRGSRRLLLHPAQLLSYHRVAATQGEAAALALAAGLDMELPATDFYGAPLKAEVEAGRVSMEVLDTAVRRSAGAQVPAWALRRAVRGSSRRAQNSRRRSSALSRLSGCQIGGPAQQRRCAAPRAWPGVSRSSVLVPTTNGCCRVTTTTHPRK